MKCFWIVVQQKYLCPEYLFFFFRIVTNTKYVSHYYFWNIPYVFQQWQITWKNIYNIPIWDFSLKLHEMNGNFLSTFSPVFIKCTFCLKLNQQTNKWNTAKVSLKLCGGTTLFQSIQWSTNKSTEYNNVSSNIRKTFNHYDFKFVILFCRGELLNSTVVSQSEQWVAPT